MIWDGAGAEAVAVVRAWQKSERWEEAMGLRGARTRGYTRRPAGTADGKRAASHEPEERAGGARQRGDVRGRAGATEEVIAKVRAEMQQEKGQHAWRKPWSGKRQREQQAAARSARAA